MLEARKKQYLKAALQAKQKNDLEQAKVYLRTAKSLEPLITAARSGKTVDFSKVRKITRSRYSSSSVAVCLMMGMDGWVYLWMERKQLIDGWIPRWKDGWMDR